MIYLYVGHLGTPRFGTDTSGTQVWAWSSTGFGVGSTSGSVTVNLRMPGQYYDVESGNFYNWNRYYNPAIGRYISSDPIGLDGGLNTFNYASQSPVMYIDPDGLDVAITINRTGNTAQSISGTIDVTSNVTSQKFSGRTLENRNPPNPNLPVPAATYNALSEQIILQTE